MLCLLFLFFSEEDMPAGDPGRFEDVEECGNMGDNAEGLAPARKRFKRTREGSPGSLGGQSSVGRASRGRASTSQCSMNMSDSEDGSLPTPNEGYNVHDEQNVIPPFTPHRPPGIHFERVILRGAMATELEFFRLFFTPEMISAIATHTNTYAYQKVASRTYDRTYVTADGSWSETSADEMEKVIALLIYFGLVKVDTDMAKYWSTKSIYHGLWARKILSRNRFKALMAFLHVVDPDGETPGDKLRKVESFILCFKDRCKHMYQPSQNMAVDERMVKSKHRSGIRQFMKDKPTKWGIKIWVIADSENGYTIDFNVYIGASAAGKTSKYGLGYDVVMKLVNPYLNQGYHLYLDNFYTSPQLVRDLFLNGTLSTGTGKISGEGFPQCMLNVKEWAKRKQRGSLRWTRESDILYLQWIDSKPVTILTTLGSASDAGSCKRRVKKDGRFQEVTVPQPLAIHRYNHSMNAVDRSDQMLAYHNVSRKCYRWWKTLFFHLIDIAVVNSFILFQKYRAQHPDRGLKRVKKYSIVDYREAIIRQICGWEEYEAAPAYERPRPSTNNSQFEAVHLPKMMTGARRNCVVCYREGRGEKKVATYCAAPQCQKFLHVKSDLDCFGVWHSREYHRK